MQCAGPKQSVCFLYNIQVSDCGKSRKSQGRQRVKCAVSFSAPTSRPLASHSLLGAVETQDGDKINTTPGLASWRDIVLAVFTALWHCLGTDWRLLSGRLESSDPSRIRI